MNIIIFKVGTDSLLGTCRENDASPLNHAAVENLTSLVGEAWALGFSPVIVHSGAVAVGRSLVRENGNALGREAAATVGQAAIVSALTERFAEKKLRCAQLLLSRQSFEDTSAREHVRSVIRGLLESDIVPLINENDPLSALHGAFRDNDELAAELSVAIRARHVLFFSNVGGVYSRNPRHDPDAEKLQRITDLPAVISATESTQTSDNGRGGMHSKLLSIEVLQLAGIAAYVGSLTAGHSLNDVLSMRGSGTYFPSVSTEGDRGRSCSVETVYKKRSEHEVVCENSE